MQGLNAKPWCLVALMLLAVHTNFLTSHALLGDTPSPWQTQKGAIGLVDVPSYRIDDTWVYETQFDIAQLLSQANISASINTLAGDTTNTVTDILYDTDEQGNTILVYEIEIDGQFTSGNNGATLEGVTGRLDIDYTGTDYLRTRDLATISTVFTLDVSFAPFNINFLRQTLGVVTFDTTYSPAKERHDFPLHNGDQWYMAYNASTVVTGTSDYFDPSDFDQDVDENNSWQVIKTGQAQENQQSPQYTGCSNSYKIAEWNATGVNVGFNWYCPAVRGSVWNRITNPAGFTIDWLLKRYEPADSTGVSPTSSPGGRTTEIQVYTTYSATLPDSIELIQIEYSVAGSPSQPVGNTNLQLRYEIANTIHNPTTDAGGQVQVSLNVSTQIDDTPSSDDYTSNGVVVYDPINKIIGATTVVEDLNVVGIDLIAQSGAVIVERTRNTVTTTLGAAIGYNALPGDLLSFSLPAQNRGVLTAPESEMEIALPDGQVLRQTLPEMAPYSQAWVLVNWTVPPNMSIGFTSIHFTVDPDANVTEDANRSNNNASIPLFVGRPPTATLRVDEGKFTFDTILLNATESMDTDGGSVSCRFEIESRAGVIDLIDAPNCYTHWNWSNSGSWEVKVLVTDEELDVTSTIVEVLVLNRAPSFNLSHASSVEVEHAITISAVDIYDRDTTSPPGQQVTISWPGLQCAEGLTQPTCTITPLFEGPLNITATATDDDGATTTLTSEIMVLNIPPTINSPELLKGGEVIIPDESGAWQVDEDELVILKTTAEDSANDAGTVIIEWHPSVDDTNWTITSIGASSEVPVSWSKSGVHFIQVRAIDEDGASSAFVEAKVKVNNIVPTLMWSGIFATQQQVNVFEDEVLNLSVLASDTNSDMPSLRICWDFDANTDLNRDGNSTNDCELTGTTAQPSWSHVGSKTLTVTVTDDDGAFARVSKNISVVNRPPFAVISQVSVVEGLVEGDNLTLSGLSSIETPGDRESLVYTWDSNHLDTDLDGKKEGDIDFTGATWTVANLPAGTWTIVLTVSDDDGASSQAALTIIVAPAPSDGILDSISDVVGGTMVVVIGLMGIIILALVAFLLFTRSSPRIDDGMSVFEHSPFAIAPAAPQIAPKWDAFEAMAGEPSSSGVVGKMADGRSSLGVHGALTSEAPTSQSVGAMTSEPASNGAVQFTAPLKGPPLPASGLPEGWSMEQWQHYGEQWLAANSPVQSPQQPIPSQSPPTRASAELQSLLDDLDF